MNRDYNTSNDKVTNALNNMSKSLKSLAETATVQIELPKINSNDPGKVLTVVGSGEDVRWDKAEPATELPEVSSEDAGDVLTVNNEGEWVNAAPATELPEVSGDDLGYFLKVDSTGKWEKINPIRSFYDIKTKNVLNSAPAAITADTEATFTIDISSISDKLKYTGGGQFIMHISKQGGGADLNNKYLVVKNGGTSNIYFYPIYEFAQGNMTNMHISTNNPNPSATPTTLTIKFTHSANTNAVIHLYY